MQFVAGTLAGIALVTVVAGFLYAIGPIVTTVMFGGMNGGHSGALIRGLPACAVRRRSSTCAAMAATVRCRMVDCRHGGNGSRCRWIHRRSPSAGVTNMRSGQQPPQGLRPAQCSHCPDLSSTSMEQ